MGKAKKEHMNKDLVSRKKAKVNIKTEIKGKKKTGHKEMQDAAKLLTSPTVLEVSERIMAYEEMHQVRKTFRETELKKIFHTLVTIATALWRIKTKLDHETINGLPAQLRHLPRHIQTAWDALSSGAIAIKDPTGKPYVPGMAVNVIAFQPSEGVACDFILETIKPSIFYNNKLIQQADVIVATANKIQVNALFKK